MHHKYMQQAVTAAYKNNTAFGATLINGKGQVKTAANQTQTGDPTLHAELHLLQLAFADDNFAKSDLKLYTTGEPCPMCAGAIIWCGVKEVYWGLSIAEIANFYKQIDTPSQALYNATWRSIKSEGGLLKAECLALFKEIQNAR